MPGTRTLRGPAIVLALVSAWGCRGARPAPPSMQRLDLGAPELVSFEGETRAAVRLRPGETRRVRVEAAPGSRMVLALGGGPVPGQVALRITAGGKLLEQVQAAANGRWHARALAMADGGSLDLELEAHFIQGRRARTEDPLPDDARIAVAIPRIYAGDAAPGRVLVWISQDTLRADHLTPYGHARPTSPFFGELAAQGTLFENAVSAAPWTLPSLASQFTSRFPAFHGALLHDLATDQPSLFETLSAAGFTVLGGTGNFLVSSRNGLARGMDALVYHKGRGLELRDRFQGFLDEYQGGDLAVFFHLMEPHLPYDPPAPWNLEFDPDYPGKVEGINSFPLTYKTISERDRQHLMALYDGEIRTADEQIRDLFTALGKRRLLERAVIAYSADHGEEFRDHGGWRHGATVYQELLHVPLLVKVPGIAPRRVSQAVSLVDLAPTLLEALGLAIPPSFQGRSLAPLQRGETLPDRPVYAETILTPKKEHVFSVELGRLKYITRGPREDPLAPLLEEQLFDLAKDPAETKSLPLDGAERLRALRKAYFTRAAAEARPPIPAALDAEGIERLKAWGYIQ